MEWNLCKTFSLQLYQLVRPLTHKFNTGVVAGLGIRLRELRKRMNDRQSQLQITEATMKVAIDELGGTGTKNLRFGGDSVSGRVVAAANLPDDLWEEIQSGETLPLLLIKI